MHGPIDLLAQKVQEELKEIVDESQNTGRVISCYQQFKDKMRKTLDNSSPILFTKVKLGESGALALM